MRTRELAQATLGGGCFWCMSAVFSDTRGVEQVVTGYSGGHVPFPTHEQVNSGYTGHAEVVRISFDPEVISYRELLELFFASHDPTTPDRQGPDVGPQYRSVIYYHNTEQANTARQLVAELEQSGTLAGLVTTELSPATTFYPAATCHQDYFRHNIGQPYTQIVIVPKLSKLRTRFAGRFRYSAGGG